MYGDVLNWERRHTDIQIDHVFHSKMLRHNSPTNLDPTQLASKQIAALLYIWKCPGLDPEAGRPYRDF
jgi:hypothetical protein